MPILNPVVMTRQVEALRLAMSVTIRNALIDPMVVEVMVNSDGKIWLDRIGEGRINTGETLTPDQAETVIRVIANHIKEVATAANPMISGVLPETGERFQGMLPPLVKAPSFTIRKRPEIIYTLDDYVDRGIMTDGQADALRQAVAQRANILIAGGTGSGKTTLANAILIDPAFKSDRVVLIEDTPELQCSADDRLELLTKRTVPPVTIQDLVKATLRLRPDRIIIGEVRDGAALDMLEAWNTGHPGGLCTLHANSATDALNRIEDLVGRVTARIPIRAIVSAINLIVYIRRTAEGRRVEEIVRVTGHDNGSYLRETVICS